MGYYDYIGSLSPSWWWKLDGDTTDSANGANSDGGVNPTWVDSIISIISETNQCGSFNASNSDVLIPNQTGLNSGTTYKKSISLWFRANTIDTTNGGRILWGEGGGTNAWVLYVYDVGTGDYKLILVVYESSGSNMNTLTTSISLDTVYHVGITLDCNNGEMALVVDGTIADNITGGLNIGGDLASHTGGAGIGGPDSSYRNHETITLNGNFGGEIADVVYWGETSTLSTDDFLSIYNQGLGYTFTISGVTYDKNGSIEGSCDCYLFKDNQDDSIEYIGYTLSDVSTGSYSFQDLVPNNNYLVTAFKDATPHIFDVTDHVLQPETVSV